MLGLVNSSQEDTVNMLQLISFSSFFIITIFPFSSAAESCFNIYFE